MMEMKAFSYLCIMYENNHDNSRNKLINFKHTFSFCSAATDHPHDISDEGRDVEDLLPLMSEGYVELLCRQFLLLLEKV